MSSSPAPSQQKFVRGMGLMDAILLVAGIMIGSGIFLAPSDIARQVGSPGWMLTVWVVAGLMTLIATLSYGELAALMPTAGGQYTYLKEAYGRCVGFLYGWTLFLVIQTGTIAAVAIGFAKYLGVLWFAITESSYLIPPIHLGCAYAISVSTEQGVAIAVILFLSWLNTRGLEAGKIAQNIFTVAKIGALISLILLGVLVGSNWEAISGNIANFWTVHGTLTSNGPGISAMTDIGLLIGIIVSLPGALFSSDGWYSLTFLASELRSPEKNLPKALGYGTVIVVSLYLLTNLTYLLVLPFTAIQTAVGDRVAAETADVIFPGWGSVLIAGAILISTFGCVNGLSLAGGRAYYAMAQDGLFLPQAAVLNKNHVPAWAIWAQGAWASVLVLPRTIQSLDGPVPEYGALYTTLLTYVISSAFLFYILTIIAIFIFRKRLPDAPRAYKAVGYPWLQYIYLLAASALLVGLFYLKPAVTLPGILLTLSGLPVYWLIRRPRKAKR
ncbi:MAG: APC family permease [Chlamydiia bacterium]